MLKRLSTIILCLFLLNSCKENNDAVLSAFNVYCEMVANDAKPVALHYPMVSSDIDKLWNDFLILAEKHKVELYREDSFPASLLFPEEATDGKTVVIIYSKDRLTQYEQWKSDLENSDIDNFEGQIQLARRFGRLLGYSSTGINELLSKNSTFRDLHSFQVAAQNTHLYYENLDQALGFYAQTLGLKPAGSNKFFIGADATIELHSFNQNYTIDLPKSTAIALLTNQLPQWYEYFQSQNVPIKYTYKPKVGGPHDGFVAIDPGGYLLEFEEFKQHPENELFMATLENALKVQTNIDSLNFYGSITWTYHKDLLKMENHYKEVFGFQLVADQGWTKIFQTSPSGFIGLVDERRGMENYAEEKAIEIEWKVNSSNEFNRYASEYWDGFSGKYLSGPEKYKYLVTGN